MCRDFISVGIEGFILLLFSSLLWVICRACCVAKSGVLTTVTRLSACVYVSVCPCLCVCVCVEHVSVYGRVLFEDEPY